MKTQLFILLFAMSGIAKSQNVNNPSFDSIYIGGIDRILHWVTSDGVGIHGASSDTVAPLAANTFFDATGLQYSEILDQGVYIDTTPYSNWALRLKTQPQRYRNDGSPYDSYVFNGTHFYTDSTGYIDFSKCGSPYTGIPLALTGYYKFIEQSAVPNFGQCEILLKRYNTITQTHDSVAYTKEFMTFNYSANWQYFSIPINYVSSAIPDSVVIVFKAGVTPHLPATFWVDELSFEYGNISLSEELVSTNYWLFPNPSTEAIHLMEKVDQLSVYNLKGELLINKYNTNYLNISNLDIGIYLIKVQKDGVIKSEKILKQ